MLTATGRIKQRARQRKWVKRTRREVALEQHVERDTVARLEAAGMWAEKRGLQGWPDREVFLGNGRHVWFEFKRKKFASLTPAQKRRIPWLEARGERVYLITDVEQGVAVALHERDRHEGSN